LSVLLFVPLCFSAAATLQHPFDQMLDTSVLRLLLFVLSPHPSKMCICVATSHPSSLSFHLICAAVWLIWSLLCALSVVFVPPPFLVRSCSQFFPMSFLPFAQLFPLFLGSLVSTTLVYACILYMVVPFCCLMRMPLEMKSMYFLHLLAELFYLPLAASLLSSGRTSILLLLYLSTVPTAVEFVPFPFASVLHRDV